MTNLDINECAFCKKLFSYPMGGVKDTSYGNVCAECKHKSLNETDSTHEIQADPTGSGFNPDFQDRLKSNGVAFKEAFSLLKIQLPHDKDPKWIAMGMSDDIAFDGKADCFEHVRTYLLAQISEHAERHTMENPGDESSGNLFDLYANGSQQEVVSWMMEAPSELHTTALGLLRDCERANMVEATGDSHETDAPMAFSEYMLGD